MSVLQNSIVGYASICIITCICCLLGDGLFACQDALVKEFERKPSVIRDLFGEPHTLLTTVVVTLAAGIFGSLIIHNVMGPAHTCSTGGVKSTWWQVLAWLYRKNDHHLIRQCYFNHMSNAWKCYTVCLVKQEIKNGTIQESETKTGYADRQILLRPNYFWPVFNICLESP